MGRAFFLAMCGAVFILPWECGGESAYDLSKCYVYDGERALYNGTRPFARIHRRCLDWSMFNAKKLAAATGGQEDADHLKANYCRDADGSGFPWCFITGGSPRRERCPIRHCREPGRDRRLPLLERCYVVNGLTKKALYDGKVSTTISGKKCQMWRDNASFFRKNKDEFQQMGIVYLELLRNFCRDPDGEGAPWCFTTDGWELCYVSHCRAEELQPGMVNLHQCFLWNSHRALYVGRVSHTISGETCQAWNEDVPHNVTQNFADHGLADAALEKNYCRDMNGSGVTWCYTTSPEIPWEACPVPSCEDPDFQPLVTTVGVSSVDLRTTPYLGVSESGPGTSRNSYAATDALRAGEVGVVLLVAGLVWW